MIRRADFADIEQSNKEDRKAEALSFVEVQLKIRFTYEIS